MTIGEQVRKLRQGAGLTTRELAEIVGVTDPCITRIELDHNYPRLRTLESIARACNRRLEIRFLQKK